MKREGGIEGNPQLLQSKQRAVGSSVCSDSAPNVKHCFHSTERRDCCRPQSQLRGPPPRASRRPCASGEHLQHAGAASKFDASGNCFYTSNNVSIRGKRLKITSIGRQHSEHVRVPVFSTYVLSSQVIAAILSTASSVKTCGALCTTATAQCLLW